MAETKATLIRCTCRGYNPADPCGHGDVADGCPKHDPAPHFFCTSRQCRGNMQPTLRDIDDEGQYLCAVCGETILCDECGQAWTDDHQCDGDDEEAKVCDAALVLKRCTCGYAIDVRSGRWLHVQTGEAQCPTAAEIASW